MPKVRIDHSHRKRLPGSFKIDSSLLDMPTDYIDWLWLSIPEKLPFNILMKFQFFMALPEAVKKRW